MDETRKKENMQNGDEQQNGKAQEEETVASGDMENGGEESVDETIEKLKAELEECQDSRLRLAAELENFKKRMIREKEEHMKYALESFAKELLPFLDNLERAIESARETQDIEKLLEGLDLTLSGYFKTLEKFGLKMFAAEGKRFDPNFHEALTTEVSPDVEENTVIKELLKGYTLHEKVLRPAMVVVSKKDA